MTTSVLLERTSDLLEKIYRQLPDPDPTLLFDATELKACAEQSPIWLSSSSAAKISQLMHEDPMAWPGLIIETQVPDEKLLTHLRSILFVNFDTMRRGVLRYSNPTTASYLFTVADPINFITWMGPISTLSWYGGTWIDRAKGNLRWFNIKNLEAQQWRKPAAPLHLGLLREQALQQQQKDQFIYQWWQKRRDVSLTDVTRFLEDGMKEGFVDAQELGEYLSLRASHTTPQTPATPMMADSEERLATARQHLVFGPEGKESLK